MKRYDDAFDVLKTALERSYRADRFAGAFDVLRQDLGLVAAAWLAREPSRRKVLEAQLDALSVKPEDAASMRFVLTWETDTNDVDLHVYDQSGHAFYDQPRLPSGGELLADITTGYGPEIFVANQPAKNARYVVQANYYARGPMGYGMGKLQMISHDGKGGLRFEERPFVVMVDKANVDLGTFSL
jgi:hypothetical protein